MLLVLEPYLWDKQRRSRDQQSHPAHLDHLFCSGQSLLWAQAEKQMLNLCGRLSRPSLLSSRDRGRRAGRQWVEGFGAGGEGHSSLMLFY